MNQAEIRPGKQEKCQLVDVATDLSDGGVTPTLAARNSSCEAAETSVNGCTGVVGKLSTSNDGVTPKLAATNSFIT